MMRGLPKSRMARVTRDAGLTDADGINHNNTAKE